MNSKLLERWLDKNKAWNLEGYSGIKNFEKLTGALGYDTLEDFLVDNSGALKAMVEFIDEHMELVEFDNNLRDSLGEDEEEQDDEEDEDDCE